MNTSCPISELPIFLHYQAGFKFQKVSRLTFERLLKDAL